MGEGIPRAHRPVHARLPARYLPALTEGVRFLRQQKPRRLVPCDDDPLFHLPPMPGVEGLAQPRSDQPGVPRPGQLHHQVHAHAQSEDPLIGLQPIGPEGPAVHARSIGGNDCLEAAHSSERLHHRLEPRLRRLRG